MDTAELLTMGLEEKIEGIREEVSSTPYNKSAEVHIGRLEARLAELKERLENQSSTGGGQGYAVEETSDATVALIGFPSAGKSTLINVLTNTDNEAGEYKFMTLNVSPGMLKYKGANIQVLDVPSLTEGTAGDRGGDKGVLSVARTADIAIFILSVFEVERYERLQQELCNSKIRLGTLPPSFSINKKGKGGINVTKSDSVNLGEETVKGILREHGFVNAEVTLRDEVTIDELVNSTMKSRVYLPFIVAVNKAGLINKDCPPAIEENLREIGLGPNEVTFISTEAEKGLDALKEEIWDALGLIRIYMGKPGHGVDCDEPLVLQGGDTIDDAVHELGTRLDGRFRFARVSDPSAKHDDQQVGRNHVLTDKDVLHVIAQR